MMDAQLLRLPWELILNVMTCYIPANPTTLITASDRATQLLLSFSLVNHATHDFAVRRMQQHCIVLDSDDRLRRFLLCLEVSRESGLKLPSVFNNLHTMYLAPFGAIMDNLPTAAWIRDVFGYASGTLKRLIVDMPFDSLPPWNDHLNVGPVLLEGFERLANLEEFVCTRDAGRLSVQDEDNIPKSILYKWPKLRRLGLNRPSCDRDFWGSMADIPHLEHIILTGAIGSIRSGFDFREVYLQRAKVDSAVTIVLADVRKHTTVPVKDQSDTAGDEDRIQLMALKIQVPKRKNFLDSNSEWLMGTALAGELWDVKGQRILEPPQLVLPHPQISKKENSASLLLLLEYYTSYFSLYYGFIENAVMTWMLGLSDTFPAMPPAVPRDAPRILGVGSLVAGPRKTRSESWPILSAHYIMYEIKKPYTISDDQNTELIDPALSCGWKKPFLAGCQIVQTAVRHLSLTESQCGKKTPAPEAPTVKLAWQKESTPPQVQASMKSPSAEQTSCELFTLGFLFSGYPTGGRNMPEKPLTVATYAAGASLAAITLVYVFAPTYFIDSESNSARKKGVVGLNNPANDCFINSVLQALAGLTDLRVYLIRETHRRHIDEPWVYQEPVSDPSRKDAPRWKIEGLQTGIVTQGLKAILDALNERPIYKKTITATGFVKVLEVAFKQRISRQQQDAQEFLQVVAERLCDEYHAGKRARQHAREKGVSGPPADGAAPIDTTAVGERLANLDPNKVAGESDGSQEALAHIPTIQTEPEEVAEVDEEDGFPMEGKYESQVECQTCHFKPRPTESTFCTLTLNVPQASSTSLNACLDGLFKTEYIDDFKCEKCRLVHAKEVLESELAKSTSEEFKAATIGNLRKLQYAIDTDPEQAPDVVLPDVRYAPKRKIARHTRVTSFPKVLAIHLSRSIYDASMSTKNSAKVSFPERLPMGGLRGQKKYKLLATVTHKGNHHSGHYESFRRQNVAVPFSTPHPFQQSHAFAKSAQPSPISSPAAVTPQVRALQRPEDGSSLISTPDLLSPDSASGSPNPSLVDLPQTSQDNIPRSSPSTNRRASSRMGPTSAPKERDSDTVSLKSVAASAKSTLSKISQSARNSRPCSPAGKRSSNGTVNLPTGMPVAPATSGAGDSAAKPRKKKQPERWWRISDEKVKEAKTSEVLGMQREVYLLFYELEERAEPISTES
ncbi:ubiquitin carboxyl-terminal hydrolase [Seiridium cupressi]